jgi:D-arabinose 1-dehydrogenase-like Zn-dependent alcohol dehydrogenase
MGMEVVVFSSTESKKEEALKFGATEFVATNGLKTFEGIKPVDALLITAGTQPDYAL